MKKIKLLSLAWLAFFTVSCSSDDSDGQQAGNMAYYTVAYKTVSNGTIDPLSQSLTRANLVNNRLFSETRLDPVTFAEMESIQLYHYEGSRLVSVNTGFTFEEFLYDASGQVVARNYYDDTMNNNFQKYTFQPGNMVYVEGLSAAYGNPDSEVISRTIVQFDAEDNLIAAGFDDNMDGVMDATKTYTYENGNLVTADIGSEVRHFTFSDIRNNFSYLYDNTFGKKLYRLRSANQYALGAVYNADMHSRNLTTEALDWSEYERADGGFYSKSIHAYTFGGGYSTTTTEFHFN